VDNLWITCGYVDNSLKKNIFEKLSTYPQLKKSYPHTSRAHPAGAKKSYPHIHIFTYYLKTRVFLSTMIII
jgi:hypothetical protein